MEDLSNMTFTKKTAFLGTGALAALLSFGLVAGTASAAAPRQAQTPGAGSQNQQTNPHPARIAGVLNSVSGNTLTLTVRRGVTATVNVNSSTWVLVQQTNGCAEGTATQLQTGKAVEVEGMTTTTANVITARTVAQCRAFRGAPAPGRPGNPAQVAALLNHMAEGTVKSISGTTVTITNARGADVVVNTTANTIVLNNGFQSVSSLKAGDKVYVLGSPNNPAQAAPGATPGAPATPRTITAWAFRVENSTTQVSAARVQSVNGNAVTVQTVKNRNGVTVDLSGAAIKSATVDITSKQISLSNATAADVKVGSDLIIEGTASADGKTVTAKAVIITPGVVKKVGSHR